MLQGQDSSPTSYYATNTPRIKLETPPGGLLPAPAQQGVIIYHMITRGLLFQPKPSFYTWSRKSPLQLQLRQVHRERPAGKQPAHIHYIHVLLEPLPYVPYLILRLLVALQGCTLLQESQYSRPVQFGIRRLGEKGCTDRQQYNERLSVPEREVLWKFLLQVVLLLVREGVQLVLQRLWR